MKTKTILIISLIVAGLIVGGVIYAQNKAGKTNMDDLKNKLGGISINNQKTKAVITKRFEAHGNVWDVGETIYGIPQPYGKQSALQVEWKTKPSNAPKKAGSIEIQIPISNTALIPDTYYK